MPQRPIFWHQGLFLQPQHLQCNDLWVSSELQVLKDHAHPYFWGVQGLEFDAQSLDSGKLALNRGEFVFRDGSSAAYPDTAVVAPRSLDDITVTEDGPVMVYAVLKRWDGQAANTTMVDDEEAAGGVQTMYSVLSNPEKAPDTLGDGPEADVQFMRRTIGLRFAHEMQEERMEGYEHLPLARLVKRQGKTVIDPDYIPPCLSIASSDQLSGVLKGLTETLVGRGRQMEGYKSPEEADAQNVNLSYLVLLMALRTMSRYAALCTHLQETGRIHPWQVYAVLRQLVAELSTFSLEVDILGYDSQDQRLLPAYDHDDLYACFNAAYTLALRIIDTIGSGPEMLLKMTYEEPYYRVGLPEQVLQGGRSFWLLLKTESDPEWVADSVNTMLKLSPASGMTTILSRAVSGIPVTRQSKPPAGLPRQANTLYFRIHTDSRLWADVCTNKELSMFWDEAPKDLTAQIAILNRGS